MKEFIAFTIRREAVEDVAGIRHVIQKAFGRRSESDLVDGLRRSGSLLFSAVAIDDNRVVGHVAFSAVTVGESYQALALAPVAVAPDFQRQGVGSALIRWGLEKCRQMGHEVVIVLGNPAYYRRFGFTPSIQFNINCPFVVPSDEFMVLELLPGAASQCRGMVHYPPEFESV